MMPFPDKQYSVIYAGPPWDYRQHGGKNGSRGRAKALGYSRIITFILMSESGASLKAAGWQREAINCGKPHWNAERYADRPKQLSLFQKKTPPDEYKQRWVKEVAV